MLKLSTVIPSFAFEVYLFLPPRRMLEPPAPAPSFAADLFMRCMVGGATWCAMQLPTPTNIERSLAAPLLGSPPPAKPGFRGRALAVWGGLGKAR